MEYETLNYIIQSPYKNITCPDCYSQDVTHVPKTFQSRYKCNNCQAQLRIYIKSYGIVEMRVEVIERR